MILSIITSGKNDGYGMNFLERLEFNLEKLNNNIDKLSISDVEIILVDWASDKKISDTLIPSNHKFTKFIYVNQEIASRVSPDNSFSHVHSLNAGFRKSLGEFIFFIDGDSYIPLDSFKKVYETCKEHKSKNTSAYYWASRYHIPFEIHSNSKSMDEIDYSINEWLNKNKTGWAHDKINLNEVQAPMGLLLSRQTVEETTGYYEKLNKWGFIEIEYSRRLKNNKCDGDLENSETYFFHLDHHKVATQGKDKKANEHMSSNNYNANNENWGLINEKLEVYKIY